ncbi:hypothetical protein L249_5989, partial [Ophiocordyceps polyrhachis-furcata BCC 54312]
GAIAVIAPESTRYSDRHSDRRARSTRCTNSGHSARPRWSYQSQIVRLIHDVEVFLQTTYLPSQISKEGKYILTNGKFIISFNFITSSIQSPLLPSILLQSSQNHHHVIRLLLLYYVIYTLITHHYFHCRK